MGFGLIERVIRGGDSVYEGLKSIQEAQNPGSFVVCLALIQVRTYNCVVLDFVYL